MFAHNEREDCEIITGLKEYPGMKVLMNCDGDIVLIVPADWEDDQIWMALDFANHAYLSGKKVGSNETIREFRRQLGIG
jgi:hypothetical protein